MAKKKAETTDITEFVMAQPLFGAHSHIMTVPQWAALETIRNLGKDVIPKFLQQIGNVADALEIIAWLVLVVAAIAISRRRSFIVL